MHQLSIFSTPEVTPAPAKVLQFRPVAPKPEIQEGVECIYPQPNYGIHVECNSPIIHVGLDSCKCSACGFIRTNKVAFSTDYPRDIQGAAKRFKSLFPQASTDEGEENPINLGSSSKNVAEVQSFPIANEGEELNPEPSEANAPTLKEGDVVLWVKNFTRVRVEWIAINNTIATVRDVSSKQAYNVPPSELQAETLANTQKRETPLLNSPESPGKIETPADKVLTPIPKEASTVPKVSPTANTASKKGGIITFGITTKRAAKLGIPEPIIAGIKICTRRRWAQRTADYYQRCYESGQTVQAYSIDTRVKDAYKMADIRITKPLYQEALKDMPESDLLAEGGLWATKEEFINTVCNGKPDPHLVVWVCWFELVNICV